MDENRTLGMSGTVDATRWRYERGVGPQPTGYQHGPELYCADGCHPVPEAGDHGRLTCRSCGATFRPAS